MYVVIYEVHMHYTDVQCYSFGTRAALFCCSHQSDVERLKVKVDIWVKYKLKCIL